MNIESKKLAEFVCDANRKWNEGDENKVMRVKLQEIYEMQ